MQDRRPHPRGDRAAPLCSAASQVGTLTARIGEGTINTDPLYNMVPPAGAPARFAANVAGTIVTLDAHLRSDGDYGITTSSANTPQGLALSGSEVSLWGVPAAPSHDAERCCFGHGPPCPEVPAPSAFFRTPTSCTAAGQGLAVGARMDSWQHPGAFVEKSISTHQPPGYPYPEAEGPAGDMHPVWGPQAGVDGCAKVPFEPTLSTALTTNQADSPTGLSVDIGLPSDCWEPRPRSKPKPRSASPTSATPK